MRATILACGALALAGAGAGCWWDWGDDPGAGREICGDQRCGFYEDRDGTCPEDCGGPLACTTADVSFPAETCGGQACCPGLSCAQLPTAAGYACLARPGGLCFNAADPPATPVGQTGTGLHCCNTLGGASGTGNLTSLCAFRPPVGACDPADTPLCCLRDEDCPLSWSCTGADGQGGCACESDRACVKICLTTGEYRGGSGLPCCDGLVYDEARHLCGLPAGEACYRHGDCASGYCSSSLGGVCD